MTPAAYTPRDPGTTVLYQVVADHLETFLATIDADPTAKGLPGYVRDEFYAYLQCGILAHGFLKLGCDSCPHKMLLALRTRACPQHGSFGAATHRVWRAGRPTGAAHWLGFWPRERTPATHRYAMR